MVVDADLAAERLGELGALVEELADELHVIVALRVPDRVRPVHIVGSRSAGTDERRVAELKIVFGEFLELVALNIAPTADMVAARDKTVVVKKLL